MSKTEIIPYAPPSAPAVSFGDMERLAAAVARSGLFGIKTPDQALALMALAQAEGRHPATVARDYHIINGSPSKKAEAMQRDFLMAGGKIEWHELSDEAVEATFSHPIGGTARIRWDTARCKQADLTGGNHKKFPQQMKRSRVVSEGVRTVWPLATSGMYEPGEVSDFTPSPAPTDTRSDLDAFAGAKPVEVIDSETGEILSREVDRSALEAQARAFAGQGWSALSVHLKALTDDAYDLLRPLIGTKDNPGELRRIAREADERAAASPPPAEPAPADQSDTAYRIDLPDKPTTDDWMTWEAGITALIDADAPRDVVARNNADNLARFERVEPMRHHNLMRKLEGR